MKYYKTARHPGLDPGSTAHHKFVNVYFCNNIDYEYL